MEKLIEELKKIAMENYDNGGDGMVECWNDYEYIRFIEGCKLLKKENVIDEFYKLMGCFEEKRNGILAHARY